jgi:SSS family transporter
MGIPYGWGVLISVCLVLFYTLVGGYWGVCWTDVLQGIMMAFGIIVVPIVCIIHIGGFGPLMQKLAAINPLLVTVGGAKATAVAIGTVVGWMSVSVCVFGQPHVVTRMMAIESPQQVKKAALLAVIWFSFTRTFTIFAGIAARVLIPVLKDPEHAYPTLVTDYFPAWLAGIMMAAVLASIMSTGDSQLLAAATTVARNIYQKIFKPDVAQKHLVFITRILVVAFAIFGLLISVGAKRVVFWMILFAYVGSGAALGIPLIAGLYWKKATRTGCIASMIAGALTVIIWKMTPALKRIIFEGVPGLIIALLVLIIVSLMTQRSPEAEKDYEEVFG